VSPPAGLFPFVQFEFGFLLGPGDGRFVLRPGPGLEPERVLVLGTLGAPERRRRRRDRRRLLHDAEAEPVPTTRATVIRAQPLPAAEAASWLEDVRAEGARADAEVADALRHLNRALHAHRVARADPYAHDVSDRQALVVRLGFGEGEAVADGRYAQAWAPDSARRRTRRSMEAPEERFAALLGAREQVLACEELVLRARADLDAGRGRQAALQARVAIEAVLAELGGAAPGRAGPLASERRAELEADRAGVGQAANAALEGEFSPELAEALEGAVARMERALAARRLSSSA